LLLRQIDALLVGNGWKLIQGDDWILTHPSDVLPFQYSFYKPFFKKRSKNFLASVWLWSVWVTARPYTPLSKRLWANWRLFSNWSKETVENRPLGFP